MMCNGRKQRSSLSPSLLRARGFLMKINAESVINFFFFYNLYTHCLEMHTTTSVLHFILLQLQVVNISQHCKTKEEKNERARNHSKCGLSFLLYLIRRGGERNFHCELVLSCAQELLLLLFFLIYLYNNNKASRVYILSNEA